MKKIFFFLSILCAVSVISAAEKKPILKVGFISDTHVTPNIASCRMLKEAWRFFAKNNCDMVVNCGDIADLPKEQAYRNYRNTLKELFPATSKMPRELYIYANHDRIGIPDVDKAFADMKKQLEIPNDPYDFLVLKGYPFLVFPQFLDMERFEKTIAETIRKFPGKPVFVLDHVPPYNTVSHSKTWGHRERRDVMNKFPSAIHISGHVHGTVFNECHIWQGEFTAVNTGSLFSGTVSIMEIFKDKVIFRRYSLLDGKEYTTDGLWSIPWPFDPRKAPFRPRYRKDKSLPPAFSAGAKLNVSAASMPLKNVVIEIPSAAPALHYYMVAVERKNAAGKWELVCTKKMNGDYWQLPSRRTPVLKRYLSGGYFDEGREHRITVTPFNFYGKKGKALQTIWKAPAKVKTKVLFESKDPMKELPFKSELKDGVPLKQEKGFYLHNVHNARLEMPGHIWNNIPVGAHLRFTADIHTIQKGDLYRQWTILLRNPVPVENANHRIYTFSGECVNRYVIDFRMQNAAYKYYLLIREGDAGKLRFNYIKLEQLDNGPEQKKTK